MQFNQNIKMIIQRTNSDNLDFKKLTDELDVDLVAYYKEKQSFYEQLNDIEKIENVIIVYNDEDKPIGCGGIKPFSKSETEIKRMYIPTVYRGNGIATIVLKELEKWSKELKFKDCILETLKEKNYVVAFYKKNGYELISNYGEYINATDSVCFRKELNN